MSIYVFIYTLPLNNRGLNFMGPLTYRFLSIANTTVPHDLELVEPTDSEELWIQRTSYKLYTDF